MGCVINNAEEFDSNKSEQLNSSNSGSLKNIGKDSLKYLPSKVLGTIMNLICVPIYTKLLVPEQYGLYQVAIAFLSLAAIIFSDWVGVAGLRFFKESESTCDIKHYFSTLLFLISSNLILMYGLVFLFMDKISHFFEMPEKTIIAVMIVLIPVAFRALLFQVLRAQILPMTYTIITIVNQFATIALSVYLIKHTHWGSLNILVSMAVSIAVVDVVLFIATKMYKYMTLRFIDKNSLISFYKYGFPIAIVGLGGWGISQSNKIILQHFHGSASNGFAGVGFDLTFSALFPLFSIITLAAIPRIINDYEEGKEVTGVITSIINYFFLAFLPVIVFMIFNARNIVLTFSNPKFIDAHILIPFLALSAFLSGLTDITTIQYHLAKKTYIQTVIRLIPSALGVLITILLLKYTSPSFILYTIGISTLATQLLFFILSVTINIKGLEWKPDYRALSRIFTASFLAVMGVKLLSKYTISSIVIQNVVKTLNINEFTINTCIVLIVYFIVLKLQKLKLRDL